MNEKFIPVGFQYYRAPTPPRSEWEGDLKRIRADGYNTVKYWIQWRWNEPRRGMYEFGDIDELMELAGKNGLKVVLNLILDVSPAWLTAELPDSVMISNRGERVAGYASEYRQIGGMPGPCFHHEGANELKLAFVEACAKRYASHPALLLWDVWNEPELTVGVYREPKAENLLCYCENCVRAFRAWLSEKYGRVEELNARWGRRYADFSEAEPPRRHGTTADMIDWRGFFCDTITEDLKKRVDAVKRFDGVHPVMCHTVPVPLFNSVTCCSDDFSIAKHCDLVGNSVGSDPMAADLLKSAAKGKEVLNAEVHACYGSSLNGFHVPDENDMLRHIFIPLAHGSKGFLFWQYRPETLGNEAPAWGNTRLDGGGTPWNGILKSLRAVLSENAAAVSGYRAPSGETAVYFDKGNEIYSWEASFGTELFTRSLRGAYSLLYRNNYAVDFVNGEDVLNGALGGYKAAYFPAVFLFDKRKAEKLREYVEGGGTAIIEALFACEDEETGRHCANIPGCGVGELLGKRVESIGSSTMIENGYDGKIFTSSDGECVNLFSDGEAFYGAKYFLGYTGGQGKPLARSADGRPAAWEYRVGRGRIIDIATLLSYGYDKFGGDGALSFVRRIVGEPDSPLKLPIGLSGAAVLSDGKGFVVVDNPSDEPKSFVLPYKTAGKITGRCLREGDKFVIEKKKTALIKIN